MDEQAQIETSLLSINVKNEDPEKTAFYSDKNSGLVLDVPETETKTVQQYVESGSLLSIQDMMKDLLQGDTSILERPEFTILNFNNIIKALEWLSNNNLLQDSTKNLLFTEGWRLNYRCKPPKPEEFLTEHYIGAQAESLYPCVKDILLKAMNQIAPYDTIVLSGCIGLGKSTMSVIINLYMTVLFALMWHPFKYFGLAPSTIFTQVYAAVSQKKASELLFEPMINVLSQSPYFLRVRTDQEVREISRSTDTPDTIAFTSSSPSSVLSFQNGANYKLISKPGGLLGQTIITGTFTELAFFTDEGWALDLKTPILMEDKSIKEMKDVKVGDKLYHPEGKENIVTDIPYEKLSDQFEITLDNGKTVKCHRNHIWKVSYRKDKNGKPIYELVTTQFMIDHPELEFDIPEI